MNTPKKSIEMTFSSNKPQKNLFDVVPDDPLCARFDEMDMHCSDSSETASEHDFDGSHMIPDIEYDESETDMDKLIKCLFLEHDYILFSNCSVGVELAVSLSVV